MVPVGDGRHDEAIEIGEDGLHGLAALGTAGGQSVGELAGLDGRKHGVALGMSEIIGDPIDRLVAVAAEFVGSHFRMVTVPVASILADASGGNFQFRSKRPSDTTSAREPLKRTKSPKVESRRKGQGANW